MGGVYMKDVFTPKMAVINIDEIVTKSTMLKEVREEKQKKMQELSDWVDTINKDIEEEQDPEKHNKLAEQYIKLTKEKEALIIQEYEHKIQDVNNSITALIDKVAKENGCNIVLPISSIITGGKDITYEVLKVLR